MDDHENGTRTAKDAVRHRVWTTLEQHGVVEPGVAGRIPAFTGADAAAKQLTTGLLVGIGNFVEGGRR